MSTEVKDDKTNETLVTEKGMPEWYSKLPEEYKLQGNGHYFDVCEGLSLAFKPVLIRKDGTMAFPKVYVNAGKNFLTLNPEQLAFLVHAVSKSKSSLSLTGLLKAYRSKVALDTKEVDF